MNREVFAILGELTKDPQERNPERIQKLAEQLTAEGSNEVKQLYSKWLEDHPEFAEDDCSELLEPAEPESLTLNSHDRDLLKSLLGH